MLVDEALASRRRPRHRRTRCRSCRCKGRRGERNKQNVNSNTHSGLCCRNSLPPCAVWNDSGCVGEWKHMFAFVTVSTKLEQLHREWQYLHQHAREGNASCGGILQHLLPPCDDLSPLHLSTLLQP